MATNNKRGIKRLCVFCGSSNKALPKYGDLAVALGEELVKNDIQLIYGGASVGLMGKLADTVMSGGGEVYGFIPKDMATRTQFPNEAEVANKGITKLELVENMHERKQKMYEHADGFCALPGGIGTLEELAETLTWNGLGYYDKIKPIVLLDDGKFWDLLCEFLDQMVAEGFLRDTWRALIGRVTEAEAVLKFIEEKLD